MAATAMSLDRLPPPWNYGVTEDGRVFFINEETRRSTWIHPAKKHPVQSGHTSCNDLPLGWEKSVTAEGATYYVDHLNERTTFHHPVTGETTAGPQNVFHNRSIDGKSDTDSRGSPGRRRSPKQSVIDKPPSPSKRSEQSEIAMQGWLHKQDSGGLKSWRRRWFVLADFCLFYYKGPEESNTLGSILLPSYGISPCSREDGISRKFAFKAEHDNMRTYYFSADSQEEMTQWINALGLATVLQRDPSFEEEQMRRLREEADAGFNPSQILDGSLGSDHRSNSSGVRDDPYRIQDPNSAQDDPYQQQSYPHTDSYMDRNSFNPYDNRGTDQFTTQSNRGFSTYSDHSPTQPSRDSGYISNRNSRPSHFEPDHSRQSSDSYFNQNQLDKAQETIDVDKMNASFEKSPFFSPKHKQKEKQGMNLRPLSDLFLDQDKGRDENFNMKPTHPTQNNQQHEQWENTPQSRYSYDAPYQQRRNNDPYGAPDVDYDAFTGRDPRLYKGYSENLAQPQSRWQDLKTPQERQEKLRSDRYGALPESAEPEGPKGSSSPRQLRRDMSDGRPSQNDRGFSGLHREESQRQPYDRAHYQQPPPHQQHPSQSHPQSLQNPIYENLNTSYDNGPGRPPLPAAYRDKIVQELAQTKTPVTRHDMLIASETELLRLQEPTFFQFPEVTPPQSQSSPPGPSHHQQLQDQGHPIYADVRKYQQQKPEPHWAPKNTDYKRQSLDRTSQKSDGVYSTIPADERNQYMQSQQHYQSQPPVQQQNSAQLGSQRFPVSPGLGGRKLAPQNLQQYEIETIKEDPDMAEGDILQTKKLQSLQSQLNGHRLRLSVTAGDLIGKSHEEMVLLLIQLRRSQSRLEDERNWYRNQMEFSRSGEKEYKRQRSTSIGRLEDALENEHEQYMSLRKNTSEIDKQIDVHKPLVNLLDNLVTMGSLYGGDNLMLTSQYKKDRLRPGEYIPPKKMIEFSRKHQEDKLVKEQEDELRQLTEDEVDLEEKLDELYKLDRELQEHSFNVSSLQEDRELLEKALQGIKQQQETEHDRYALDRLMHQRKTVDNELSKVRQQLAESSKILEETAVENARVENEVMLLRKRIAQSLNRSNSFPNLSDESARTKQKLEQELSGIQTIMEGLNKQGAKLSRTMASLRHSNPDLTKESNPINSQKKETTYAETDLDSMHTTDLATYKPLNIFKGSTSNLSMMPNQADSRPVRRDQPPMKPPHTINHQKYSQPLSVQTSVPYRTYSGYNKPTQNYSYNNNTTLNSYRGSGDYNDSNASPMDIRDADDNTKRFYGLLPKDRPRVTVRDVKKRESERRSKRYNGDSDAEFSDISNGRTNGDWEPSILRPKSSADLIRKGTQKLRISRDERRQSATERLFPKNQAPASSASSNNDSRRFSDLVNPRPYSARPKSLIEPASRSVTDIMRSSPTTVAKVRPVSSYTANSAPTNSEVDGIYERRSPATMVVKSLSADSNGDTLSKKDKIRERHKGAPRGRFLTVSSSSPMKLEQSPTKKEFKHTAAGDLIISSQIGDDIIRAEKKDETFDPFTIDREVLFMPEKVEIPERYIPDSEDEEEQLTTEEKIQRQRKAKQMRRIVAAQSLQDWTKDELGHTNGDMHKNIEREKKRREKVLDIRHALAREVTQKTREIAERSMMDAVSPTDGDGLTRTGSERRRSELHLRSDLSPTESLSSPFGEEHPGSPYHPDSSVSGYDSNQLTNQVLYYGPEVLDNTQDHLDVGSLDMGLCT